MSAAPAGSGPLSSADVSVKLFVQDPDVVRLEELIPVYQRWIAEGAIEDELLIDVANYAHVPKGPGVVLVCDQAHYYFDVQDGRPGLRYRGRRVARATGDEAVARAFRSALAAAALLESEPSLEGRYRFRTDEVEVSIPDRLHAPSNEGTLAAARPVIERCVKSLYGVEDVSVEMVSGPREPFTLRIGTGASPSVEELLGRVSTVSS